MHRFVAARGPAGAASDKGAVIDPADQQDPGVRLLLVVTLQAQRLIAGFQEFRVH